MQLDLRDKLKGNRILIVLSGTFSSNGGMFEYAKAWVDFLIRRGWEVGFCGVKPVLEAINESCDKFEIPLYGVGSRLYKSVAITSLFNAGAAKKLVDSVENIINVFGANVVHIVDRTVYSGYILDNLTKRIGTEALFVNTLHDPVRHDERRSILGELFCLRDDRCLLNTVKRKNVFIHVHDLSLLKNSKFEKIENVLEMPHPLPVTITNRVRREIGVKDVFPLRVGFLGRIEPYKGLDILYESICAGIRDGFFDKSQLEIVIAGRGEIADDWKGLPIRVEIFNSMISNQDFHQLMADLDLLVLPYKGGTQSGVGMLGAAYGIPMIATKVGALPSLVIDGVNGYLIEPNRSDLLASILKRIVANPTELIAIRRNQSGTI